MVVVFYRSGMDVIKPRISNAGFVLWYRWNIEPVQAWRVLASTKERKWVELDPLYSSDRDRANERDQLPTLPKVP